MSLTRSAGGNGKRRVTPMAGQEISTTRLEAFSDGVIAIIITIMVLELKVPHEATMAALLSQWPIFFSYALSYLMVAIYWMNHHPPVPPGQKGR
jgi:uncharacterized membrane protein